MLNNLFTGIFDTAGAAVISVPDFLLCIVVSLLIGAFITWVYTYKNRYTTSFAVTLAMLPAIVCIVIMMVNGNVGAGVAVAGAFSLVRFRSVPGTAKEIGTIFLAMAAGLIAGGVGIGGAEAEDGKRGERLLEHVCSPYEWGMRKCTAWSIQCIRFQDAFAQLRAAVTNV